MKTTRSLVGILAGLIGTAALSLPSAHAQRYGSSCDSQRGPRIIYHQPAPVFQRSYPRQYQPRSYQQAHRPTTTSCAKRSHGGVAIKLIAGHQSCRPNRPTGWHSREWFVRRGYNLDNFAWMHRDGTVRYGRNLRRR